MRSLFCLLIVSLVCVACQRTDSTDPVDHAGDDDSAEARAAIEACQQAQQQSETAAAEERAEILAQGCAGLFFLPMCSQAIEMSHLAREDLRAPMISIACQHSYCQLLENSPPRLCSLTLASMTAEEMREPWNEFVSGVLSHELDLASDSSVLTELTQVIELLTFPESTPEEDQEQGLVIRIEVEGTEFRVNAILDSQERFGPWILVFPPNRDVFAGLLENAIRQSQGKPVMIEATQGVSEEVIVALVDTLMQNGFEDIGIGSLGTEQ